VVCSLPPPIQALEHKWFAEAPLPAPASDVTALVAQAIHHKQKAAASQSKTFDGASVEEAMEAALGGVFECEYA
jgi:hypothetical protein